MLSSENQAKPNLLYRPSSDRNGVPKRSMLWNTQQFTQMAASTNRRGVASTFGQKSLYGATKSLFDSVVPTRWENKVPLEQLLFDAGAKAKISASLVSMYLREGWRDRLFQQLDNLLDPSEWDPEDKPLHPKSFETFLKAICDINPSKRPGLGISFSGNLIAAWRDNVNSNDRISMEFMPDGKVKLVGSRLIDEELVLFSALTPVAALKQTLLNLNCSTWLGCEKA
jgi:hypothetical protein